MRILIVILLSVLCGNLNAQTPQQWESYGDKSVEEGDHYGASIYYHRAVMIAEENAALWMKYGMSLMAFNDYEKAEAAFQAAWDKHMTSQQAMAQYWLAVMQKQNGFYRRAYVNFEDFARNHPNRGSRYISRAEQEMQSCRWAMSHKTDSSNFELKNIGGAISTEHSEFSPLLNESGDLLFTSLRYEGKSTGRELKKEEEKANIRAFMAAADGDAWKEAEEIEIAGSFSGKHIGNACFGPEEKTLYFSLCEPEGRCEIWRSERNSDGSWAEASTLNEMVNMPEYTQTQPWVSEIDGRTILFFVSDRPRGRGGMDIWYTSYDNRRKAFAKPRNMGRNVNTAGDELSPFWLADSSHLYFSSDWHNGYGGFDVFMTKGKLNSLYSPRNMGIGINTPANDFYFKWFPKHNKALLASNREGGISLKGQTCCNDLYLATYVKPEPVKKEEPKEVVEEKILEKELEVVQDLLPLSLYFHNDQPNPGSWSTSTDLSYREAYGDYHDMLEEYVRSNRHISARHEADTAELLTRNFFKNEVEAGIQMLDSVMEMLKHQLTAGHKIELTIKGFASPLARSDYNHNLTERRISSLINYIERYENGWFLPYLNPEAKGGKLTLIEEPYGETKASDKASDDHLDRRRSIYGLSAARERRIEIIRIEESK